ncbi:MAG: DinB family protein [Phycisphaerae bacterium]|jgi:hypothetical protein|nr:DinB family protein [Phycisphaerae bacterium]
MTMHNAAAIIDRLARTAPAVRALTAIVSADDARWKPAPEHWSVLEIACHLCDEEREDFGYRLRSTLETPEKTWPPLDLKSVAEIRGYNQRDLAAAVDGFCAERERNIAWLRSLPNPDWSRAYIHPKVGPVSAGELLTAWGAHDALHLRQLAKRLFNLAERDGAPNPTRYAGEWTA